MADFPTVPAVDFLGALPAARTVVAHQDGATPLPVGHLGAAVQVVVVRLAGVEVPGAEHQVGAAMVGAQHMAVVTEVELLMAVTAHERHMVAPPRTEEQHRTVAQHPMEATMAHVQRMAASMPATAHLPGAVHQATQPSRAEVYQLLLPERTMHQHQAHMRPPPLAPTALTLLPHLAVRPWTLLLLATTLLPRPETRVPTNMVQHLLLHQRQALGNLLLRHRAERTQVIIEFAKAECV